MIIRWIPKVRRYAVVAEPEDRVFLPPDCHGIWTFKTPEAAERLGVELFEERVVRA